jgi:hypothetical protein
MAAELVRGKVKRNFFNDRAIFTLEKMYLIHEYLRMNTKTPLPLPESTKTVDDVLQFHRAIWSEGVSYHPEEDFFNYVHIRDVDENGNYIRTYTDAEATLRNNLLDQAYEVCEAAGVDICEVGLEEYIYLVTGELPSGNDESESDSIR